MRQNSQVILAVAAVLLIGCQTSNTAFITATADPFVPAPDIPTETATGVATRAPTATLRPPSSTKIPSDFLATPKPLAPAAYNGKLPEGAVARLGAGMFIRALSSPDGRLLAITSGAGIRMYQIPSLEMVWSDVLEQLQESFEWSPDGTKLAIGGMYGEVVVWDAASGKRIMTKYAHHNYWVDSITWASDSRVLASGGSDGRIILWNTQTGSPLADLGGDWDGSVDYLAFSPDDSKLLAAYHYVHSDAPMSSHSPIVWEVASGKPLYDFNDGYGSTLSGMLWSPNSKWLATMQGLETVAVRDAQSGAVVRTFDGDLARYEPWSPDGNNVISLIDQLNVWDVESNSLVYSIGGEMDQYAKVSWSADGKWLAYVDNATVTVADGITGVSRSRCQAPSGNTGNLRWSPDSKWLLVQDLSLPNVFVCNPVSGEVPLNADGYSSAASWFPEQPIIAVSKYEYSPAQVVLWSVTTGQPIGEFVGSLSVALGLKWSVDGKHLAVWNFSDLPSGTGTTIWETNTWALETMLGESDQSELPDWAQGDLNVLMDTIARTSPDGTQRIDILGKDNPPWDLESSIRIVNASSHEIIAELSGQAGKIYVASWSPDGQRIVTGGTIEKGDNKHENELILWTSDPVAPVFKLLDDETSYITNVAWSPDGVIIAVAYGDNAYYLFGPGFLDWMRHGKIALIDSRSGALIRELKGHSAGVQRVAFSPDGTQLASSGQDGTVIIWQVK